MTGWEVFRHHQNIERSIFVVRQGAQGASEGAYN